jgi:hypothetical protein
MQTVECHPSSVAVVPRTVRGATLTSCVRRAAMLLLAIPGLMLAQGRIGGFGRGARGPGKLSREPGIEIPSVVNPINLLILHRQDLALSDTQFAKVIVMKRALDSANAPMMKTLDSIQHTFRSGPLFSQPNRERRDSLAEARAVVQEMVAAVDANIAEAKEHAYEFLSASQLATASDIEEKARKASQPAARGRP